jgi:hypothetical protein
VTDTGGHLTTVPEITRKPKLDPVSVATTKLLLATGANSRSTRTRRGGRKSLKTPNLAAPARSPADRGGNGEPIALNAAHVVACAPATDSARRLSSPTA